MNYLAFKIPHAFALMALLLCSSMLIAQDDAGSNDTGAAPAATAPAQQNAENPPLSGLDAPTAEPAFGGRSYMVPGLQLSESANSNGATTSGNGHVTEITRAVASVDLQKIWRQYQLGLDYIGGGDFYTGPRNNTSLPRATQVHTFAAAQRILWRTGQLAIRDSLNYLPEGSFGFGSYGGAGAFGSSLGGISGVGAGTGLGGGIGGGTLGGIGSSSTFGAGYQPRVSNDSTIDVVQGLSPRSTVTMAGTYGFTNYLDLPQSTVSTIINGQQLVGQAGYNHLLNPRDQIGFQYAFQDMHFPRAGSGSVNAHILNALYGHRVTGKLDLTIAGGPQFVILHHPPMFILGQRFSVPSTRKISGNGSVKFAYTVSSRTHASVAYQHYLSPGSGYYAGANTDTVRMSLGQLFGRHWVTMTDVGYSHHSNLQKVTTGGTPTSGVSSRSYQFWYAGTSLQRQLGKQFSVFASYQFNDMGMSSCVGTSSPGVCGVTSTRHTGTVGINWHARPIRLD